MRNMIKAKPITCRRCGCEDVAWAKNRNGKFYLVQGSYCHPDFKNTPYMLFSKVKYHSCDEYRERQQGLLDAEKTKAEKESDEADLIKELTDLKLNKPEQFAKLPDCWKEKVTN